MRVLLSTKAIFCRIYNCTYFYGLFFTNHCFLYKTIQTLLVLFNTIFCQYNIHSSITRKPVDNGMSVVVSLLQGIIYNVCISDTTTVTNLTVTI